MKVIPFVPKKPQFLITSTHSLMGLFAGVSSLAQSLGGHKISSLLHPAWLNPLQRDHEEHFSLSLLPLQQGPAGCGCPRTGTGALGWAMGGLVFLS